jgi:hypothetical protein
MASHQLIDDYLTGLARRLPADTIDELADGITETWHQHIAAGRPPIHAARATIAEFGTPEQITDAFVAQAPGRRAALVLLATGPVAGTCWGASLIVSRAWTWPIPHLVAVVFGSALLLVAATLAAAATSRHSYRRTRLAGVGGLGLLVLDAAMLAAALLLAPTLVWPMAVAIPVSLARITWTIRSLPRTLAS